ncbi:transcription factor BIM2 [Nicotiana tabacum]|uniref:Transcription factor BIM2 n=2 Tax=Nicotiana TaxID=4085 RepID=A0A1S4B5L5_TOBAC|nr:PREDICTED: transcription factor BIM2-like [Nicotiana sylvestris]XP_009801371.1 PREDICTED: transcription factor BIM2-like [Nicotiana sylvestris]XP_016484240.1 PREDICTED: transcription factor BIM2-like [Nicotiana tabacum]
MVRTVKTHHEDDEEDDEEFSSRTPDGSSQKGKSNDGKGNSHRSKHSETEQRRRIKINERFQALRNLIPETDQKRDRASFLLEVIQYIQFLQEKLQWYEGAHQGWSAEPSKLMPWRSTSGPVEGFVEQSQIIRNGSTHEDNIVINPTLLTSAQNSVEPNLSTAALYTDDPHMEANEAVAFNMPLQCNLFENASIQPSRSSPDAEHCASQPQSLYWPGKQDAIDSDVPSYGRNDQEEVKVDGEEAGNSNVYSQRLLSTLNQTLASMGVDLSQANVKVQLDIAKCPSSGDNYDHARKRLRTESSM